MKMYRNNKTLVKVFMLFLMLSLSGFFGGFYCCAKPITGLIVSMLTMILFIYRQKVYIILAVIIYITIIGVGEFKEKVKWKG